jgi:DNA polymerase type B, organellar and viral/DNA polymerase family B
MPDQPRSTPIAVRAHTILADKKVRRFRKKKSGHPPSSEWRIVIDTETMTDASQRLRFGTYLIYQNDELKEEGFFSSLEGDEQVALEEYAKENDLALFSTRDFVDKRLYAVIDDLRGHIIGLNLPFDLSRLAIKHSNARRSMRSGFSLSLSENTKRARVRIKHLNARSSIIQLSRVKQTTPRGMRNRGMRVLPHLNAFIDVKTLAGALLSGSWSLEKLADHLKTNHRKLKTDEHGGPLTKEYLDYAMQDVRATWECFKKLEAVYMSYGLSDTPITKIYSEASLGKAYLQQMGIRPWQELQPDFPPELLGKIKSTYFGGRSEVHIRRKIVRVLYCDFLSMYPTVCILMGLWRFVVAKGMSWQDTTSKTQAFLNELTIIGLQKAKTWRHLSTIVRLAPRDQILPVRAKYNGEQFSIGVNYLTSEARLWYTLADCIVSKLLTGRTPKILESISFFPKRIQSKLKTIEIAGNANHSVDPIHEDPFRSLIDSRIEVKARMANCPPEEEGELDQQQLALKICANAITYGIYMEHNVQEQTKPELITCYGPSEKPFENRIKNVEEPGKYSHPLLATLITGAARLMLGIAEKLAVDVGIDWAFCDTDSMALARPEDMNEKGFIDRAKRVQQWFTPLNPYTVKEDLFKIEPVNYKTPDAMPTKNFAQVYCYAVSSKRYALFTQEGCKPNILKASAHGMGHLLAPYEEKDAPIGIPKPIGKNIGVARWQHDVWYRIIEAALDGHPDQVYLDDLPNFDKPAISRYAATSPILLSWFKTFNRGKKYCDQVKPFNFMLIFHIKDTIAFPTHPVAPYDRDHSHAILDCFDRETGHPIATEVLATGGESLKRYHLHPESKFENGDYFDQGVTTRRHIKVESIEHIGKEANQLDQQLHMGYDSDAQVYYGCSPEDYSNLVNQIMQKAQPYKNKELAEISGVSVRTISELLSGRKYLSQKILNQLQYGVEVLETENRDRAKYINYLFGLAKQLGNQVGLRKFAAQLGIDHANLINILAGRRKLGSKLQAKLENILLEENDEI